MKKLIFIFFFFLLLFIYFTYNKQKTYTVGKSISINNFNWCDIQLVENTGKFLIPIFIDSISLKEKGLVGFKDPEVSNFEPCQINNYLGIAYAYYIENILGYNYKKHKMILNKDTSICKYRVYQLGVILKIVDNDTINKTLNYNDVKIVQSLYKNWWSKNKYKSLLQLQIEWESGIRVLNNSHFACE